MIRFAFILITIFFTYLLYSQDLSSKLFTEQTQTESEYNRFFSNHTLRIDYLLAGNDRECAVYLWQVKEEPYWGGPHNNLIDPWNSGNYRFSVYDTATDKLLYRKGFSSLFEEFQGTQEAKQLSRAYPMTATMPYPLYPVRFEIDHRNNETGQFESLFSLFVNPHNHFIIHEEVTLFPFTRISDHGASDTLLDIALIAEGYTNNEITKFRDDARRITDYMMSVEPYASYKHKINVYAIESPSVESGVDIPGQRKYANTNVNSSFYTFGSERYLTTPDTWSMRDIAANVPYDQIIILSNSKKYGGGGFYNHYCQSTVDNLESEIVTVHEFGHAFGGLADEYVGGVNYDGFYNLQVEPWEPNITTMIDFDSKWRNMISDTIPLPTPRDSTYSNVIGLFEGGGYLAKGMYSPVMNCRMKDNSASEFCPVCQEAIRQKILFYCD